MYGARISRNKVLVLLSDYHIVLSVLSNWGYIKRVSPTCLLFSYFLNTCIERTLRTGDFIDIDQRFCLVLYLKKLRSHWETKVVILFFHQEYKNSQMELTSWFECFNLYSQRKLSHHCDSRKINFVCTLTH